MDEHVKCPHTIDDDEPTPPPGGPAEPATTRNGDHVIIRSDYPGEASIHVMRHRDGDFGIAVAKGDRWPGMAAATMCSSGGRNPDAWQAVAALWRSADPSTPPGGSEPTPGVDGWVLESELVGDPTPPGDQGGEGVGS